VTGSELRCAASGWSYGLLPLRLSEDSTSQDRPTPPGRESCRIRRRARHLLEVFRLGVRCTRLALRPVRMRNLYSRGRGSAGVVDGYQAPCGRNGVRGCGRQIGSAAGQVPSSTRALTAGSSGSRPITPRREKNPRNQALASEPTSRTWSQTSPAQSGDGARSRTLCLRYRTKLQTRRLSAGSGAEASR
jgi:hypothetical protein